MEVTWNDSVPPSSDKELRAQLSYFGDVTRSFQTGHRGVVMFSNHEGAHRCIEDYRGPWSVRLVNAKGCTDTQSNEAALDEGGGRGASFKGVVARAVVAALGE